MSESTNGTAPYPGGDSNGAGYPANSYGGYGQGYPVKGGPGGGYPGQYGGGVPGGPVGPTPTLNSLLQGRVMIEFTTL